ncbi:MAG: ribokinase [Spirochaetia bacterium]
MNKKSILVVGSINMDLIMETEHCPEAGESVIGSRYSNASGGKGANLAVAAARLGAEVTFVGRVGNGRNGSILRNNLAETGVATDYLISDPYTQTGLAVIILEATGDNRIVVVPGANSAITVEDLTAPFSHTYDAVVTNLEIPPDITTACRQMALRKDIPFILDAGPAREFDLSGVSGLEILSPNETETKALIGAQCGTIQQVEAAARELAERSKAKIVVIKLGERGAYWFSEGAGGIIGPYRVDAVDTTAAGDAFTAGLTLEYLKTGDIAGAVQFANAVGALTVTKLGAQPSLPDLGTVQQFIQDH